MPSSTGGCLLRSRQFLRHHRLRRPWPVDAADHQGPRLRCRCRRLYRRHPLRLRRHRDDAVGSPVGQGWGTKLVRGQRIALGRGVVGCLQLRDVLGAHLGCRALRRCGRDHVLPVHLLADPVELSHRQRCRRRPRDDRLDRQSRWLCRPLSHRRDQAVDRQFLVGPDLDGRISHPGRHPHPCGWRQSAATGRGG